MEMLHDLQQHQELMLRHMQEQQDSMLKSLKVLCSEWRNGQFKAARFNTRLTPLV